MKSPITFVSLFLQSWCFSVDTLWLVASGSDLCEIYHCVPVHGSCHIKNMNFELQQIDYKFWLDMIFLINEILKNVNLKFKEMSFE